MNDCKQIDNNWLINFFPGQVQFISTLKRTVLLCLKPSYSFTLSVFFLNGTSCIINNGNILTDESDKCKKIKEVEKAQNVTSKNEKYN